MADTKVLLWCFVNLSIIFVAYGFDPPQPEVRFLRPRGFEVSIPARPGISLFAFHGNKNRALNGVDAGTWNQDIRHPVNGRFTYVNRDAVFEAGDKLYFWTHVIHNGLGYNRLGLVRSPSGDGGNFNEGSDESESHQIENSFNTRINFRNIIHHHNKK